jgi:hypothetical protein
LLALLLPACARAAAVEATRLPQLQLPGPLASALARSLDRLRAASSAADDGRVPRAERDFYINGWHWHNLVVEMHLRALAEALHEEPLPSAAAVQRAWAYLWDFSAVTLHRTEGRVFLPWVRGAVRARDRPAVARLEALAAAERERGQQLDARVRALGHTAAPLPAPAAARLRSELVALRGAHAAKHARALALVVPLVAAECTAAEQRRVNQQIIQSLGIGGARLHLVAMHEVCERSAARAGGGRALAASLAAALGGRRASAEGALGGGGGARVGYGLDGDQRAAFRARIPWVARSMLPRWRSLYEAEAGPLLCRGPTGARGA